MVNKQELVEYIINQRSAGISDREIIENLRDEGHKNTDILEALKKSDIKAASSASLVKMEPSLSSDDEEDYPSPEEAGLSTGEIEALAEKIVAEKWDDVKKELDNFHAWKDEVDSALDDIKKNVNSLSATLERLKISISEQVSAYAKDLSDVSTDIKAMDKVFKEILPEFTSNVQQLSTVVDKIKKKK